MSNNSQDIASYIIIGWFIGIIIGGLLIFGIYAADNLNTQKEEQENGESEGIFSFSKRLSQANNPIEILNTELITLFGFSIIVGYSLIFSIPILFYEILPPKNKLRKKINKKIRSILKGR